MKITFLIQTIYQKFGNSIEFFGFEKPTHKMSQQSILRWKKTFILTNPVSSYVLQSGYVSCRVFLLPWQQNSPNINFWTGVEESFYFFPIFHFWDRAFQMKICCKKTDLCFLAITPPPSP